MLANDGSGQLIRKTFRTTGTTRETSVTKTVSTLNRRSFLKRSAAPLAQVRLPLRR